MVALDLAFTAAVRVIHGVHGHAAHRRLNTAPTRAASFAKVFILVIEIAHLANRRRAIHGKFPYFTRRQFDQRQVALFAEQLRRSACRSHYLSATPWIQFQVVHLRAGRNVPELHGISRKNVRAFAGGNRSAYFEPHGMQNVALLAVGIVQERQIRAAVRVVLDGRNRGGHAGLVATEIHFAILLLVAAAAMPNDDLALIVAAASALFRLQQIFFRRLLGDMALVQDGHKPPRRCVWIKTLQSHRCLVPSLLLISFFALPILLVATGPLHVYRFSEYSIIFSPAASFT